VFGAIVADSVYGLQLLPLVGPACRRPHRRQSDSLRRRRWLVPNELRYSFTVGWTTS
jgi:hypothetical protein